MNQPVGKLASGVGRSTNLGWDLTRTWVGLFLVFAALVYFLASRGSAGDLADRPIALTTAATMIGPFAGAVARHWQGCCLDFSIRLAVSFCGPALAVGLLAAVVPLPNALGGRAGYALRVIAWSLGWSVWFLGAPASFLHALA